MICSNINTLYRDPDVFSSRPFPLQKERSINASTLNKMVVQAYQKGIFQLGSPAASSSSSSSSSAPTLKDHEVHIWKVPTERSLEEIAYFSTLLNPEEAERAKNYKLNRDRHPFIVARGILRTLLSYYTGTPPQDILFSYNKNGKPSLTVQSLQFNLSHTKNLALYAFSHTQPIGIDVEDNKHPLRDISELVRSAFSLSEQKQLNELSEDRLTTGFWRCWTRKEAFTKAIGKGFGFPWQNFDVSIGISPKILQIDGDAKEAASWSLNELSLGEDYTASLAIQDHQWVPCLFELDNAAFIQK